MFSQYHRIHTLICLEAALQVILILESNLSGHKVYSLEIISGRNSLIFENANHFFPKSFSDAPI